MRYRCVEVRSRAYLPELSDAAIDPQRVRCDAGDSVARLAKLPQRGSARRRAGVQRAATAGAAARGRLRLRALSYYARVRRRGDQHRWRRRLTRATVVAAFHALPFGNRRLLRDYDENPLVVVIIGERIGRIKFDSCVSFVEKKDAQKKLF